MDKIRFHVCGDSHSAIFNAANDGTRMNDRGYKVAPIEHPEFIFLNQRFDGVLAYNILGKHEAAFDVAMEGVNGNDIVMLVFGEIDCRYHLCKHFDTSYSNTVKVAVDRYIEAILKSGIKDKVRKLILLGPHPSKNENEITHSQYFIGTQIERNKMAEAFNEYLFTKCLENGIGFFTFYYDIINEDYTVKSDMYFDDFHLKYSAISDIINNMKLSDFDLKAE